MMRESLASTPSLVHQSLFLSSVSETRFAMTLLTQTKLKGTCPHPFPGIVTEICLKGGVLPPSVRLCYYNTDYKVFT